MKWIGQHIWSFISRFRSDVYVESSTVNVTNGADDDEYFQIKTLSQGVTTLTTVGDSTSDIKIKPASHKLLLGDTDGNNFTVENQAHDNGAGSTLSIKAGSATAGQTNQNGGSLNFYGGAPTGSGTFGNFNFYSGDVEASGTSLRTATQIAQLESTAATSTDLTIYEKAGASASDYFKLSVAEHGATTLSTLDASATAANLNLEADGDINNSSTTNKINKTYDFHGTTFENTYSDGEASGTILKYSPGGDATVAGSTLYYLRSNTGQWATTDADQASISTALLGVGLGGSAQTVGLLLEGFVRIASTEILNVPGSGEVDGLPVYVSTTAGHFDFTAPSGSGDIVRIVGYAIDDDSGDVLIYFKPDNTWVEIA